MVRTELKLTIFSEPCGIWDVSEDARRVPFSQPTISLRVSDPLGNALSGCLNVNGVAFPVTNGKCKLLTEKMSRYGGNSVEFTESSGVKHRVATVTTGRGEWYFPNVCESVEPDILLEILTELAQLQKTLESARSDKQAPISQILGI
ncbi:MAG: hypothetical protein IJY04_04875 [Clostridia bacterium]|nr:hypothetical protein [Clostridia bacterium]